MFFLCYLGMEGDIRQGVLHLLLFYSAGVCDPTATLGSSWPSSPPGPGDTLQIFNGAGARDSEATTPPPCILHALRGPGDEARRSHRSNHSESPHTLPVIFPISTRPILAHETGSRKTSPLLPPPQFFSWVGSR